MEVGGNATPDVPPGPTRWYDQRGLEGIEVALISGLTIIALLIGIPLVGGGVQAAIAAVANALATAGAGIN